MRGVELDGLVVDEAGLVPTEAFEEAYREMEAKADPHGLAEDLSPEAIAARAEAQRMAEEFAQAVEQWDRAKRIKARRRRLGRNGFATRSMAVPSKHAKHRTRNSR